MLLASPRSSLSGASRLAAAAPPAARARRARAMAGAAAAAPDVAPEGAVSAQWLRGALAAEGAARVRVLDASWFLPTEGRDPRAEHTAKRVTGAKFFDIEAISDRANPLPHMLPGAPEFQDAVRALGVGQGDCVVVYDAKGLFSAARAWWMFRVFGHDNVAVLDGGLPAWEAAGGETETGEAAEAHASPEAVEPFVATYDASLVADLADVQVALAKGSADALVVDARGAGRFAGEAPEPRPGVRAGHMPGAANVPMTAVLGEDKRILDEADVRAAFEGAGAAGALPGGVPAIASCGTGVTACVLALALFRLGRTDVAVYDGSWSEWGAREDTAVATGSSD